MSPDDESAPREPKPDVIEADDTWPVGGHRQAGQALAISADEFLSERVQADADGEPLATDLLLAIYHELRHGNELGEAQTEVMAAHSDATAHLRDALDGHADALDRHRGR